MKKKRNLFFLLLSVVGFLLVSVSFLLMPLNSDSSEPNVFVGVLFWCSLLIGIVSQVILTLRVKRTEHNNSGRRLGLLMFFQNPYAIISDIVLIISIIGFTVTMIVTNGLHYSCYIFLAMTVFFFSMHCIFNGKNYYYTQDEKSVQGVSNSVMLVEIKKEREKNEG